MYIVMDELKGPTLMDALHALVAAGSGYTEGDVRALMGRLLDAVNYMHLMGGARKKGPPFKKIKKRKRKMPFKICACASLGNLHGNIFLQKPKRLGMPHFNP